MKQQKVTVSVIGSHNAFEEGDAWAYEIGREIAALGCVLVSGGLGGIMEAASRGCHDGGGLSIGIIPGKDKKEANPYVDIALPTTLGFARNIIVAASADIIVALPGSHGTRTEISYAVVYKCPVIDLGDWNIDGMIPVDGVEGAKAKLRELVEKIREK